MNSGSQINWYYTTRWNSIRGLIETLPYCLYKKYAIKILEKIKNNIDLNTKLFNPLEDIEKEIYIFTERLETIGDAKENYLNALSGIFIPYPKDINIDNELRDVIKLVFMFIEVANFDVDTEIIFTKMFEIQKKNK